MSNPTLEQAIEVFAKLADAALVAKAQELCDRGKAEWVRDPYIPTVFGLLLTGTNNALVVVYPLDNDFETSADFETSV